MFQAVFQTLFLYISVKRFLSQTVRGHVTKVGFIRNIFDPFLSYRDTFLDKPVTGLKGVGT